MVARTPFVGRVAELGELSASLSAARAGRGGLLLVRGETGAGKSRLVAEALAGEEALRLEATAVAGGSPYGPVCELLEAAAAHLGAGPWATVGGLVQPDAAPPDPDPDEFRWVMVRALLEIARREPAVLVLEDLHHAGDGTLAVLGRLAGAVAGHPLLVIATYDDVGLPRDHGLRRLRASLRRADRLHEVSVGPLGPEESAALFTAVTGPDTGPVAPEVSARIHRITGGLSFFVEELARAAVEGGVPDDSDALPESVTDAVLDGTRELYAAAGEAIDLAAVLGEAVDLAALAELVGPEEAGRLVDAGLLVEVGDRLARFRHTLVQQALLRSLPWSRRRALHQRVAEWWTGQGHAPEVAAAHWEAAGLPARARPLLLEAARRHCVLHAYGDAAAFARRALGSWPTGEQPRERAEVLAGLADCAEKSEAASAAVSLWAEVVEARRALGDRQGVAGAARRQANAAELAGDLAAVAVARAAAAEAFAAAGAHADAIVERLALADHLRSRGRLREAMGHLELARQDVEDLGDEQLRARVMTAEGVARSARGEHDRGLTLARAGLELALSARNVEIVGENYYEFAEALLHATEYAGAADTYQLAADYCAEHGASDLGQACRACMSVAVRFHGDWDRALEICRDVLGDPGGNEVVRAIAIEESSLIGALRGAHRKARAPLRRTLRFGERHGVFGVEVGSAWGLAVCAAEAGDEAATRAEVVGLLDRCEEIDDWNFALPGLRWASTTLATMGEERLLARCQHLMGRAASQNSAPKTLSVLAHAGAELSLLDDPGKAAVQFERAVELLGTGSAPYEWALASWRWGVALGRAGDREQSLSRLVEAHRTARRLGAKPLARACADELAVLGEHPDRRTHRGPAPAPVDVLTPRERQVLALLADGHTNRAIAADLVLSVRTVDMHVRNILQKLDCPSRTAAGRRAAELGLLSSVAAG